MSHMTSRYSKMPFGVSDRDLVQKICTRYEESEKSTYILYYHTTHPTKPPVSGVVRLVAIIRHMHADYF